MTRPAPWLLGPYLPPCWRLEFKGGNNEGMDYKLDCRWSHRDNRYKNLHKEAGYWVFLVPIRSLWLQTGIHRLKQNRSYSSLETGSYHGGKPITTIKGNIMNQNWSEVLSTALSKPGKLSEAYSAFHGYSLGNQIAAMSQCAARGIELGPIASFKAWGDKGRKIRKGEKAIALCMPVTCKGEKVGADGTAEEFTFSRFVWRNNWFVLGQTEGDDFAQEIKIPSWDRESALAKLGITEGSFAMSDGNCQGYASGRMIAVSPLAVLPHKTRFHELAHVVLGHTAEGRMQDSEITPKDIRELEAEGVAYLLCTLLGLPGTEESRGYMQSWFSGSAVPEKSAQRIFGAADKILKAGQV